MLATQSRPGDWLLAAECRKRGVLASLYGGHFVIIRDFRKSPQICPLRLSRVSVALRCALRAAPV